MSEQFEGIDESGWPLVHVDMETLSTTAGDDAVIQALDALLARNERFGLSFEGRRRGGRDRSQEWLAQRQEDLGRLVIGVAYTVAPATLARNRELAASMNPYPFPVWPATTREECAAWVQERIAEEVTAGHT